MPKLQQTIETLTQARKQFTEDIADIETQIAGLTSLSDNDRERIALLDKFIVENESSSVPEVVARVNANKQQKADIEKEVADRKKTIQDLEKDKKDIEENPVNQQMVKELGEARTKLDSIYETLEKDPVINAKLQEAVRFEYFTEIQKLKAEQTQYQELSSKIEAAIKDDSADGLKDLVEKTITRRDTYLRGMNDDKIDPRQAQANYLNSKRAIIAQIKTKFGVELKSQEDLDYILDFASGKITGEFALPSAVKKAETTDKIVAKLEEKRDERLAELSSKAVAPASPENTAQIEDNQKVIEQLEKENTETYNPAIAEATQKIDEIDEKITQKTQVTPEDVQALADAEKDLKENHVISEEVVTDLKDENSDISKLFAQFVEADKELRKAFKKNEHDKTDDAKQKLQDAIMAYKGIAEELANRSGYDIESWQNYNKHLLNERIDNGETIDSIYTYPKNRNFYKLADDKHVKKSDEAVAAYNDAFDKLDEIDEQEAAILDGDFTLVPGLVSALEEYHSSMDVIQNNAGPELNVYGVLRGNALTKVSLMTRFKNFVGRAFNSVKTRFEVPNGREGKRLVDAYLSKKPGANLTDEEKEEIEALREEKDKLTRDRQILVDKRDENQANITSLETQNAELSARDAARTASELGTAEELSFVTREGVEAKGYVAGKSVREDIKKVIDDEGR